MAKKSGRQTRTRTRQTGSKQSGSKQSGSKQSGSKQSRQTKTRQTGNRSSQRKTRKQGRRLNEFMRRLGKARESNAESFNYKGNTYVRKELETGMAVYGKQ